MFFSKSTGFTNRFSNDPIDPASQEEPDFEMISCSPSHCDREIYSPHPFFVNHWSSWMDDITEYILDDEKICDMVDIEDIKQDTIAIEQLSTWRCNSVDNWREYSNVKQVNPIQNSKKQSIFRETFYDESSNLVIQVSDKEYVYPQKAGTVIFSDDLESILLCQSRSWEGNVLWGLPKGHKENRESIAECACRETLEETGIAVKTDMSDPIVKVNNTHYFVYKMPTHLMPRITPHDKTEVVQCGFHKIQDVKQMGQLNKECHTILTKKLKLCRKLAKTIQLL